LEFIKDFTENLVTQNLRELPIWKRLEIGRELYKSFIANWVLEEHGEATVVQAYCLWLWLHSGLLSHCILATKFEIGIYISNFIADLVTRLLRAECLSGRGLR
jgi:hypothetical protein